jgi:hypothetical protein
VRRRRASSKLNRSESSRVGESRIFRIVIKLLRIDGAWRVSLLPSEDSPYRFVNFDQTS